MHVGGGRRKKGQLTALRAERLVEVIGPLMAQGMGCQRIADKTGLPRSTVSLDMQAVKKMWSENHANSREEWSGRLLGQYEWMLSELADAWQQSKTGRITRIINPDGTELIRQEPPDPRWLSGMLAVAKETSTFLGIREGVDTVSRLEVPDATKQALAPMSEDAYQAMLANSGGLAQLNAVPPISRREEQPVEVCIEQQGETAQELRPSGRDLEPGS
jgi:hypothetical protein